VLRPHLVLVCSMLAKRAAAGRLRTAVPVVFTTHPATSWWHTKMRKYKDRSGKQMFIDAIRSPVKASV
jgi:hypothetical protein